jgi:hypothetical protein
MTRKKAASVEMTARAELRPLVGRRIVVISIDRKQLQRLLVAVSGPKNVHDDPQVFVRVQTQIPITHTAIAGA